MSTSVVGTLKADQLAIGRLVVDRLKGNRIEVLAGLTNSKTGTTHGWLDDNGVTWSDDTRRRLAELLESMEQDLVQAHFADGVVSSSARDSPVEGREGLDVPSGGIGERLGTSDEPQSI